MFFLFFLLFHICYITILIYFVWGSGERYTAGVGQVSPEDEIKREIVHQLCIRPMAHSELVKALPEDVSLLCTQKLTFMAH